MPRSSLFAHRREQRVVKLVGVEQREMDGSWRPAR
jgi:hypothetical protein